MDDDTLLCPISHAELEDPVVLLCGHAFNSDALKEWLGTKRVCPVCMVKVPTHFQPIHVFCIKDAVSRKRRREDPVVADLTNTVLHTLDSNDAAVCGRACATLTNFVRSHDAKLVLDKDIIGKTVPLLGTENADAATRLLLAILDGPHCNDATKLILDTRGAVYSIVNMLVTEHNQLAAELLQKLSASSTGCDAIAKNGAAISRLFGTLMCGDNTPQCESAAAWTLCHLARTSRDVAKSMVKADYVRRMMEVLEFGDDDSVLGGVLNTIRIIAENCEGGKSMLIRQGCVPRLTKFLNSEDAHVVQGAVWSMHHLTHKMTHVRDVDAIAPLCALLLKPFGPTIMEAALRIMSGLHFDSTIKEHVIPGLKRHLEPSAPLINKQYAAICIANLALDQPEICFTVMHDDDAVRNLVLMVTSHPQVAKQAVAALSHLTAVCPTHNVVKCAGTGRLIALMQSEDKRVSEMATQTILNVSALISCVESLLGAGIVDVVADMMTPEAVTPALLDITHNLTRACGDYFKQVMLDKGMVHKLTALLKTPRGASMKWAIAKIIANIEGPHPEVVAII